MYKCCPKGAEVDIDALATKQTGVVLCLACCRWFIGPGSPLYGVWHSTMPGDLYIDADGSMHTVKLGIRQLVAELAAKPQGQE